MMKRLTGLRGAVLTLVLMAALGRSEGQEAWNFSTVEEATKAEAYLLPLPEEVQKRVEKEAKQKVQTGCVYHLAPPQKRRKALRFLNDSTDFSLGDSTAAAVLPYLISDAYWRELFCDLLRWGYIDVRRLNGLVRADEADTLFGGYSPLHWYGYRYQPSVRWPVVFSVETNNGEVQQISIHAVEYLAEQGAFLSEGDLRRRKETAAQEVQKRLEERNELQAMIDSLAHLGLMAERTADSMASRLEADSLALLREKTLEEVARTKERMDKDQIFILNIKNARSDYMFGLELNMYNCFKKTITKVELTVAPYNDRGTIQKDKFERTVRTVRCMGPIEPGNPAQYLFDELFWDDSGRIKFMRVNAVTFHFVDGTYRVFSGYERIRKHTLQ